MSTGQANNENTLQATIEALVQPGKGILAADESEKTIAKRFQSVGVGSTVDNRRWYRSSIIAAPGLGDIVSGIIFFEETLTQRADDGTLLPALAAHNGIVAGVKVDKGKLPLSGTVGDEITQGLDGLAHRLTQYQRHGARFAKWRNVYHVTATSPSRLAIASNAEVLARYAAICQAQGMVPIVEPEVLMDGDHSIDRCAEITEAVVHEVFHALHRHGVALEYMLLKPNMVIAGKDHLTPSTPEEVATYTIRCFRRVVPAAVPSINFLSGGQTPIQATANLNALNSLSKQPWALTFSFGRALQEPALDAWRGDAANEEALQSALVRRAKLNGKALLGAYEQNMELLD
ncbi:class I fructose-bisphosphate aldolase [Congregibacter variabilis]|uniref:fructose-bisphosphate aldolase n=1 Tax=Congregibacter variabilis TaxID=3081200 RepID=A0ABZ0I4N9_9GAMM|nr:class I fructose-bisphosphate aldolase [Congregibacter sp. IMCC43200]